MPLCYINFIRRLFGTPMCHYAILILSGDFFGHQCAINVIFFHVTFLDTNVPLCYINLSGDLFGHQCAINVILILSGDIFGHQCAIMFY